MRIEYANECDFEFILKNDHHVHQDLLLNKILNKEILIMRDEMNHIIGWLRFNYFWDHVPFMNLLYLLKEHRSKGYGKALVEFWENEMRVKEHKQVMTSTLASEDAQHFYRKCGYKDSGCLLLENEPLEILFIKKF